MAVDAGEAITVLGSRIKEMERLCKLRRQGDANDKKPTVHVEYSPCMKTLLCTYVNV